MLNILLGILYSLSWIIKIIMDGKYFIFINQMHFYFCILFLWITSLNIKLMCWYWSDTKENQIINTSLENRAQE